MFFYSKKKLPEPQTQQKTLEEGIGPFAGPWFRWGCRARVRGHGRAAGCGRPPLPLLPTEQTPLQSAPRRNQGAAGGTVLARSRRDAGCHRPLPSPAAPRQNRSRPARPALHAQPAGFAHAQ